MISDDKVFDLLEKVYFELQGVKNDVNSNRNHIIRLEDKVSAKIGALSDEVILLRDDVRIIKDKIEKIEGKVESHGLRIKAVEGGQG